MLAVVRVRGSIGISPATRKTFELLKLKRANNCVLLQETTEARKMADKVKDYIAFGTINEATLARLLEKRGRKAGDRRVALDDLKKIGLNSFNELAKSLAEGKLKINEMNLIKTVFRLKPPSKGFERKGIKKDFAIGGALGFRGEAINELLQRMI
ncbi:50S ribosomal protein L30 [archaeon]|nr:50S ribosomal protein L30 [archaeon]